MAFWQTKPVKVKRGESKTPAPCVRNGRINEDAVKSPKTKDVVGKSGKGGLISGKKQIENLADERNFRGDCYI